MTVISAANVPSYESAFITWFIRACIFLSGSPRLRLCFPASPILKEPGLFASTLSWTLWKPIQNVTHRSTPSHFSTLLPSIMCHCQMTTSSVRQNLVHLYANVSVPDLDTHWPVLKVRHDLQLCNLLPNRPFVSSIEMLSGWLCKSRLV